MLVEDMNSDWSSSKFGFIILKKRVQASTNNIELTFVLDVRYLIDNENIDCKWLESPRGAY